MYNEHAYNLYFVNIFIVLHETDSFEPIPRKL